MGERESLFTFDLKCSNSYILTLGSTTRLSRLFHHSSKLLILKIKNKKEFLFFLNSLPSPLQSLLVLLSSLTHSLCFFVSNSLLHSAMDTMEATNRVLSRIQSFDPHNASKILGYILIREHGDKDVIRLAHGPDAVLLSLISQVKAGLGLSSSSSPPFSQASLRITIPPFQFHSSPPLSPWSNADVSLPVDHFRFLDESEETHRNQNELEFASDSDDGMYNPPRKLLHAPTKQDSSLDHFLRMKAHRLQHQRLHYPLTFNNTNTIMSNLNENPPRYFLLLGLVT